MRRRQDGTGAKSASPVEMVTSKSMRRYGLALALTAALALPASCAEGPAPAQAKPDGGDVIDILQQNSSKQDSGPSNLPLYPQAKGQVTEEIQLELPPAEKLLPLAGKLPPIKLEASFTRPISLRECLQIAYENNLPIRIQRETVTSRKWLWLGALGQFLPNALMQYQHNMLAGSTLIGGILPVSFHTPNVAVSAGFQMFGFRGGGILFNSLVNLHQFKAARAALKGSINDVLLQVARLYYELMRNEALLQVQTVAVDISRAQLVLNQQLERAGTGTHFNVLQAETQLARDEQDLLIRQVGLRQAALNLGVALNVNLGVNLLAVDRVVRKVRLIDPALTINDLLAIAIQNRPELKQYQELRLAARRQIQVAAAPLYPQFQFYGSTAGNGPTLSPGATVAPGSFSVVPIGTPLAGISSPNNIGLDSPVWQAGVVYNPASVQRRQVKQSYRIGFQVDWNYNALGVPDLANVQSSRALARQAMLQANQILLQVSQQVRQSYLNIQTAEKVIDVASAQVVSSGEQYRLAKVRLTNGVGINLDVIQAQQAYTQALVNKANAIIEFNIAQAQLLRDLGIISLDTLTSGRLVGRQ